MLPSDAAPSFTPNPHVPGLITLPYSSTGPRVNLHDPDLDDRNLIVPGDQSVMIVEDDLKFASYLLDMARARPARDRDFQR